MQRISIGVVGAGQFSRSFIPLFQAHPGVSDVYLAEEMPDRLRDEAARHRIGRTFGTFDELLASDVDAVAIFSQRWSHGPMAAQALRRGKHVYSSVPMGTTEDEIATVVDLVASSGLTYMMGETSYYYPAVVYCRRKFAEGAFGHIVYGEGDYLHDMDNGFYKAYKYSGGPNWRETASWPPMLYPTHSVGGVLGVTGAHATKVSCFGFPDREGDGVFDTSISRWNNDLSNATALFHASDGSSFRTNEFRRVGYPAGHPERHPEIRFSVFGTEGSFEQQLGAAVWQTKKTYEFVTDQLVTVPTERLDDESLQNVDPSLRAAFVSGFAPVHDRSRLPDTFTGRPNGHEGSHQFLADDFVTACTQGTLPPVNAWVAARYNLPGITAHASALAGGELLTIPDLGDPPSASRPAPSDVGVMELS